MAVAKILVLSVAHFNQLDRRITAEMNSLSASGRHVTLVSLPAVMSTTCLDPRVRVFMPPRSVLAGRQFLKSVAHRLPWKLGEYAKTAWRSLHPRPFVSLVEYFIQITPRETFDVIHCHDLDTLPAAVALRQKFFPTAKLIYDSHEFFPFQFPRKQDQEYWLRIETAHINAADVIITVNESIAQELIKLYGIRQPEVIYNSYSLVGRPEQLDKTAFLQHFRTKKEGFRVLFHGGFVREKNLVALVKAFQHLTPTTQLFLLGDGPIAAELKRLCKRLQLSNVFFGAWVPQEDLLSYVAHAHLGVIPYSGRDLLNNLYCTPNKLFEFIETEVPICSSDLPELRRIVQGHGLGDVYPMESPAAIAEAIENCHRRCTSGEFTPSARRLARATFSWDKQEKILMQLYARLGV